jgi:nicotinate phosphoribosyltransferase
MDFYKFTMGQFIFRYYPDLQVRFALTNRTKSVRLADMIDLGQLREELEHLRSLRFTKSELHYLRGTNEYGDRMFGEDYLTFLSELRMPEFHLEKRSDGQINLWSEGDWPSVSPGETPGLAILAELYCRHLTKDMTRFELEAVRANGIMRLQEKHRKLRQYPFIKYSDFGHRRRAYRDWHDFVVSVEAEEMAGQFLGTSDAWLAMKYGLLPMGTNAHELGMVIAAFLAITEGDAGILRANREIVDKWWQMYGQGLSIALPDTFGSDTFLQTMNGLDAVKWKGFRHDSGDPIEFGEKIINFYEGFGVDPREHIIVFSDGLNVDEIIRLALHFKDRIKVSFGWGTTLTNDLGFKNLSIVIKVASANGQPAVKLSDNIAKAVSPSPEEIERYKRLFGYHAQFEVVPTV